MGPVPRRECYTDNHVVTAGTIGQSSIELQDVAWWNPNRLEANTIVTNYVVQWFSFALTVVIIKVTPAAVINDTRESE